MATPYIDDAFVTKFNTDLYLSFEQQDSHFRGLCRTDASVIGETLRFQKLGGLSMTTKPRYEDVPLSIPAHSHADVTAQRHYCRTGIEAFDLTLLNANVRGGYATKMAGAGARKIDEIIVAALDAGGSTNVINSGYSGHITLQDAIQIAETFDSNEVPDDGMRMVAITPRAFSHLMTIDEFSDADYVGSDGLPFKSGRPHGRRYKDWLGLKWFTTNRLTGKGTSQCKMYAWHPSAVGHGIMNDLTANWSWNNVAQMWDGVCGLQMGAVVIDDAGVIQIQVNDTTAIP